MNTSKAQSYLAPSTSWDDPAGPLADLRRTSRWPIWVLLAVATWIAHGWSLHSGLFLDDHWHQSRLSAMGWSINEMLEATTLEPERFMEAWWQDRSAVWRYSRPVSVFVMKVVHELTGGHIPTHHAVSVLLHFLTACMVFQICLMLTHHRSWSAVGGILFVVYSHGVFAVSWLAAQNVVLQTALTVAALLLYIRASGLYLGPVDGERPVRDTPPLNRAALSWAFALWVLAIFSRENAVMLPAIMLAFDLAYGGRGHLWARRYVYVLFGCVTSAFLYWRLMVFYVPMPDVYYRHAGDDGYLLWCLAKLLHYLCSSVWLSPMTVGPSGRFNPFSEVPGDCLLMVVILSVMAAGYYFACRHLRGYWIWPFWLLLALLPIVPVMATPHSGYLGGVAFAVGMVLGPGLYLRIQPHRMGRVWRVVAIWFLVSSCAYVSIYRTTWKGMIAAERITIEEVVAQTDDQKFEGVTDVFLLNLPFVNIYAQLCLARRFDDVLSPPRYHVLTYAPSLLSMKQPCILTQHDEYTFSISVAGTPYFSRLLGRFLIEALRTSGPFQTGEVIPGDLFDVTVTSADERGVSELRFMFHQPLASNRYRFYLSTPQCAAMRLTFAPPRDSGKPPLLRRGRTWMPPSDLNGAVEETMDAQYSVATAAATLASGRSDGAEILFVALGSADAALRQQAWINLVRVALPVARATGATVQDVLAEATPPTDGHRIKSWWRSSVDDRVIQHVWVRRSDFTKLYAQRRALFHMRSNIAGIIQTDLYLTGPPFPGPR